MHQVDVDGVAIVAAHRLTVTHQETGDEQPLTLSAGQLRVLRALAEFSRVVVLKGRQVYISTCCCLYALFFAACNPGVKVAIVADLRDKAEGLLAKIATWAPQAGFPTQAPTNTKIITLWNGAEIHALTANSADQGNQGSKEAKAGRSFSYGLIILSEFAYYTRDAALLRSITRSALQGAHLIIETTATPADNKFRSIWERGRGWHKVFLSFEKHEAYQLPVDAANEDGSPVLTDAKWAELRSKYGFTSRTHATYWWRMVQTDMDGDVHGGLREAPILPEQAFAYAEGRWIFGFTETEPSSTDDLRHVFTRDVPGGWRFYDEPDESGVIIGVDTAGGVLADASAIFVIGRDRGNPIATFCARDIVVPDYIGVVRAAIEKYKPFAVVVDGVGVGKGVYQAVCNMPGVRVYEHNATEAEKPTRMDVVRVAIQKGQIAAGAELVHEIKHSVQLRPKKPGGGPVYDGPDDLLNALGFALVFRLAHPWRTPEQALNPRRYVDRTAFRKRKGAKVF